MTGLLFAEDILDKSDLLASEFEKVLSGKSIAVKLHFGELGNNTSLKPDYARTVVSALKKIGARPFLFDSSVSYHGHRSNPADHRVNAEKQGFTEKTIGCPLVFSDEIKSVKTKVMTVEVCKPLADAEGMVVLTHCKGHICTGMGGAIKNLGMGGVSKKTKREIHDRARAVYVGGCIECGLCEKICYFNAINLSEGHPEIGSCGGCDACVDNCPEKALKVTDIPFDTLISVSAQAVVSCVDSIYYINVMKNITEMCDCMSNPGPVIAEDAGVLMGKDILSIDKASVDMIRRNSGNIFKKTLFKDPMLHLMEAEKLGMGSMEYTIKNVH